MRKILKRIGAGILALSLVFTPNMSASAYGGGGGAGGPMSRFSTS